MTASITLGAFAFGPGTNTYIPQYGFGENAVKVTSQAPGFFRGTVTLNGSFRRRTHAENMSAYNALKAAIHAHELTLLISDGPTIFNRTVNIDSHNLPLEWNSNIADFEITCSFVDTDVSTSGFTCSFAGFVFDPPPALSQSYEYRRKRERSAIDMVVMSLQASGFFSEASFDLNLAKILAARDAFNVTSGTFLYNRGGTGINSTAYVKEFSAPEEFVTEVAPYRFSLDIFIPSASLPVNIVEEQVQIIDRVGIQRHIGVPIPGIDGRTIINLGLSESRFAISGVVEADTFVNATARIAAILAANVPVGAILETQSQLRYEVGDSRVEFQYDYSYNN